MAEIPKLESSNSASLLAAQACLGLAVTSVSLCLAFSMTPVRNIALSESGVSYDNIHSRRLLSEKLPPESLVVIEPEKKLSLPAELTVSWLTQTPAVRQVRVSNSLLQYFYAQTGTAHPWTSYQSDAKVKGFAFQEERLGEWISQKAADLFRQPQDAELVIKNGRATKFREHLPGAVLVPQIAFLALEKTLLAGQSDYTLPLETRAPKLHLADLNRLGIKERIATGQSDFTGSSAARINNIRVGAARYNGIILAPGEEFSFNKYLGSVDAAHGFKPELVIKPEGATPEYGGGLCQVSTTAFRAAFFGGLPITQRRNHSYAVKYYEWIADDQPRAVGLDATIYAPYQDMKFVNDTPGSLLIWTRLEGKRLYFDFFGTPDDREVVVDGPHPFDKRPSGAVKSTVSRKVIRDGESQDITFNSSYIPPKTAQQTFEPAPVPIPPPAIETPPPITN